MASTYDFALGRMEHDLIFEEVPQVTGMQVRHSIKPINGADRVAQQIKMTLLTFLGEWFLDIGFGVPYLEEILVKNPRLTSVESILRAKIKAVPDVQKITSFAMNYNRRHRTLQVEFTAHTLLGTITDSVTLDLMRRQ
jgi:hypothetical protein